MAYSANGVTSAPVGPAPRNDGPPRKRPTRQVHQINYNDDDDDDEDYVASKSSRRAQSSTASGGRDSYDHYSEAQSDEDGFASSRPTRPRRQSRQSQYRAVMHALSDDNDEFDHYDDDDDGMMDTTAGSSGHGHMHSMAHAHAQRGVPGQDAGGMYGGDHSETSGYDNYAPASGDYGHHPVGSLPRARAARGRGRPRKKVDSDEEEDDLNIEEDDEEYVYSNKTGTGRSSMNLSAGYHHSHHGAGVPMHVPGMEVEHPLRRKRGRPKSIPYPSYHDAQGNEYSVASGMNQNGGGGGVYYDHHSNLDNGYAPNEGSNTAGGVYQGTHPSTHAHAASETKVVPTGAVLTPMSNGWSEMLSLSAPVNYPNANSAGNASTAHGSTGSASALPDDFKDAIPQSLTITIPNNPSAYPSLPSLSPRVASAPVLTRRPRSSTFPPPSLTESMVIAAAVGSATTPRGEASVPVVNEPLRALGRSLGITQCDPESLRAPLPLPGSKKASGAGGVSASKDDPMLEVVQHLLSLESNGFERTKEEHGSYAARQRAQNIIFRIESPDASPHVFQDSPEAESGSLTTMIRLQQGGSVPPVAEHRRPPALVACDYNGPNRDRDANTMPIKQDPYSAQSPIEAFGKRLPGMAMNLGTTTTTTTTTTTSTAPTTTTMTILSPATSTINNTLTGDIKPANDSRGSATAPDTNSANSAQPCTTTLKPLYSSSSFFNNEANTPTAGGFGFHSPFPAAPGSVVGGGSSGELTGFTAAHHQVYSTILPTGAGAATAAPAMPLSCPPTARGDPQDAHGAASPFAAFSPAVPGAGQVMNNFVFPAGASASDIRTTIAHGAGSTTSAIAAATSDGTTGPMAGGPIGLQLKVPTGIDISMSHAVDYTPVPFPKSPVAPVTGSTAGTSTTTSAGAIAENSVILSTFAEPKTSQATGDAAAVTNTSGIASVGSATNTATASEPQKERVPPLSTISIPLQVPNLDTPAALPDSVPWDSPVFSPGLYSVPFNNGANNSGVGNAAPSPTAHDGVGGATVSKQVSTIHLTSNSEISGQANNTLGDATVANLKTSIVQSSSYAQDESV